MFETFELWVSKTRGPTPSRLLPGKSRFDRYVLRGQSFMLSYVELKQIVKFFYCPLVWHLEENCKTRELRIWKPRKDLSIVIQINIELFICLNWEIMIWVTVWLYLSMYDIVYISMTCCKWHDRIPSAFRLCLLSIVAHPFPSFPVYICRSPVASRAGPISFDVQIGRASCRERVCQYV